MATGKSALPKPVYPISQFHIPSNTIKYPNSIDTRPPKWESPSSLINGPNLNLLGTREPHIYGHTTLSDVESNSRETAASHGAVLESFQSNHEGAIVDRIQAARGKVDGIIINPGAYTHTSVAIRDALLSVGVPFIELHVSNVHAREPWRHHSYFSDKAAGIIVGLGVYGYKVAVEHVCVNFEEKEKGTKAAL
ncbi:hypothetical protein N7519_011051 [Penicillium mononematosum]|uniref:uncharacterized protein n=1 Tax=Penicillium mononematosum TaxID=268346 RepID=UPI002547E437|nr:uncharacterized protein N7519_011051 [Penicillium mononematosum]KAJ6180590.1 hypothetical protein N7519_011051 [Penicillium mononematosum]